MKRYTNISSWACRMLLFTGIITGYLAMSTVSVQLGDFSENQSVEQSESGDKSKQQDVLKAVDAITSSVQISLDHHFALIDVLPELHEDEAVTFTEQKSDLAGSKVLKILFRRIISPNAP